MTDVAPKRGVRFVHPTVMDNTWVPEPGQTWSAAAPKAKCVVTAVQRGRVYWTYDDSHNRAKGIYHMALAYWRDKVTTILDDGPVASGP